MSAGCYTASDVRALLRLKPRTFHTLKAEGKLPFLEELRPRLGHTVRYRADLVDRYLAGHWGVSSSVFGRKRA